MKQSLYESNGSKYCFPKASLEAVLWVCIYIFIFYTTITSERWLQAKILLKIDTSVYNFIISQQGCYNQEYPPRSRPSHEHLLLAKISHFTHLKEILKPSFNHVYSPFYLTTSYQINIVNNFCLKNVSISIGVWKMIAAWLQKGEKTLSPKRNVQLQKHQKRPEQQLRNGRCQ